MLTPKMLVADVISLGDFITGELLTAVAKLRLFSYAGIAQW